MALLSAVRESLSFTVSCRAALLYSAMPASEPPDFTADMTAGMDLLKLAQYPIISCTAASFPSPAAREAYSPRRASMSLISFA